MRLAKIPNAALAPASQIGGAARRLAQRLERGVRYAIASTPGLLYRVAGRHPNPDVADNVLADRIRSTLGPLEHRLDVPRIHVMVEHHIAILHGDVPSASEAATLEHAVMAVSGVRGVESHLHNGLIAGDTRPSEGVNHRPSDALRLLLDRAHAAGAGDPARAVHAVLCGFADRIPPGERAHLMAHLPADVREVMSGPARHGETEPRLRTVPQLIAAVVSEGGIEPGRAEAITRSVVATLRTLVPEEARDIAAVLPTGLAQLWNSPVPVGGS
jgi:uncharacterized protein (DUF2267 family)